MKKTGILLYSTCLAGALLLACQSGAVAQVLASRSEGGTPAGTQEEKAAMPLKRVLTELEARYEVSIFYKSELVENEFVEKQPLEFASPEAALDNVFKANKLTYVKIRDKVYVIVSGKKAPEKEIPRIERKTGTSFRESSGLYGGGSPESISALQLRTARFPAAAAITITGRVTAQEDGSGLPGVNVLLKGTSTGTTTNAEGSYSLSIPDASANGTLVFSYIGYTTQEVPISGRTAVNIALAADIQSLSEVVVVGYGTQIRKDVTGSIASVKAEDIRNLAVTSADALLQGKAAGVQVVQNAGNPGAEIFVRVRGTATLRADARPLFVIDGVPMNNTNSTGFEGGGQRMSSLADINPNDIESMEILKDGAATAIYGSRGSNGVILITTKRGKSGQARFNFDAYTGVQQVWRKFDLLNGDEMNGLIREAISNRNRVRPDNLQINPDANELGQFLSLSGPNTNWQDEVFRPAPISNYNFSMSGGEGKIRSFVSLGIFNQKGTLIGQEFNRYNGRLNLDYEAARNLKVGASITYSQSNNQRVGSDFSGVSVLATALLRTPNLPVRDEFGRYSVDPLGNNGVENPVMLANEIILQNRQKRFISNLYAEYTLLPGLTFRSVYGIDNLQEDNNRFEPSFVIRRQGNNQAQAEVRDDFTWISDNTLNFSREVGQHRFNILGGIGFQQNRFRGLVAGGNTTPSDLITNAAVTDPFNPGNPISEWRLLSFFGRANYSFMDRYVVELSFRRDGSSRFGRNTQYGNFPAISAAWRVKEENFMQNIGFISDLKLRAAYGVTGNQEGISNFAARALYNGGANYDGRAGIVQGAIPNFDLGWESTRTTNAGIDLGLFNNRVNISADAYIKNTTDLLFQQDLPWTSGYWNIPLANIGSMENRGIELMFSTVNTTGEFKWTTDFNIAFNRNKITSLPEDANFIIRLPDAYSVEGPYSRYTIGEPVGSFYGYKFLGVYARDEDVPEYLRTGNPNTHFYGGYPIILDANGDGLLNRDDHVFIGNALPLHTGGFTNTFSYKGFELNIFMAWSYGNMINNMTRAVLESMSDEFNQSVAVRNRWQNQGDVTNIPRAMYQSSSVRDGFSFTDASSRFIEDGSFLRVRNATLAYNIPGDLLSRVKLSSARIYVSGQNLLTFTNYTGLDPENQNTGGGLVPTLGVDYLTQPQPRIYMVGVNLGF